MNEPFCGVLAVHDAHRRGVALAAATQLAELGGVPLTVFDITRGGITTPGRAGPAGDGSTAAQAIRGRDGALLVIEAFGGGPLADRLNDADAERLLATVPLPTLAFGPHATSDAPPTVLVIAADAGDACLVTVPAALCWASTFRATVVVVGLESADPWPDDGAAPAIDRPRHIASTLAGAGLAVDLQRRTGVDPATALVDAAVAIPGAVLVVPGARFPSTTTHWFSTSRRLIRHAPVPVLLAPERPDLVR